MTRTIALLTDFGTSDIYVGVMKGVMLGICPDANFIDLTHAIEPQNVREAAFVLLNSYRYLPAGTVFLTVVDPGVGSERGAIAVRSGGYTFVAPDNGLLSYVLREIDSPRQQAVELNNPAFRLSGTSNTFHGRDIFAPAAAHLAAGASFEALGRAVSAIEMLPLPMLRNGAGYITGEALHIDHFGTVVSSIGLLTWDELGRLAMKPRFSEAEPMVFSAEEANIRAGDTFVAGVDRTYADVGQGEALALVGSNGYLELSVNGGSFAQRYHVKTGDPVALQIG